MTEPLVDKAFQDPRHELVGGAPELLGPWQLNLLVDLGLQRNDSLLDLGCGTLRAGLHFIAHLVSARYTGAEPREELLEIGRELVTVSGLQSHLPRLLSVDELDRSRERYDWILTHSVLNHLDAPQIVATVARVHALLAPKGRWVSTICFDENAPGVVGGEPHGRRRGEFWRSTTNPGWFRETLRDHDLEMCAVKLPPHPRGMDVFVATFSTFDKEPSP